MKNFLNYHDAVFPFTLLGRARHLDAAINNSLLWVSNKAIPFGNFFPF